MMLTQRLILKQKLLRYTCIFTHMRNNFYSTKNKIDPSIMTLPDLRLSEHKKKMKQREPFVKNFFRGMYDIEFAAFPEPQTHERHGEFFQWLKSIEDYVESNIDGAKIDKTGEIPSEIIEDLKCLGVFRAAVPQEYNGLGLNCSEYGKLIETLSRIPVIGAFVAKWAIPINFISAHASDAQKTMYLPRISNGECIPSICISEDVNGSEGSAILSHAKRSNCGNFWLLNGIKKYVVNGNVSNLFIVLADCTDIGQSLPPENTISAFLVDRSSCGITIEPPVKMLGFRGLSLCDVTFKDTMIPIENLVGEIGSASQLFTSIFSNGKECIGAQAIGITKQYLKLLINHIKNNNDFHIVQFKNDAIQEIIGKICYSIYGMESVLYLTTGIMDTVINQDCDMEKCIVESYCVDACMRSLIMGTHILGLSSQIERNGIEQLIRDAICLISTDGTKANLQSVIPLMGLQYLSNQIGTRVRNLRNPSLNPMMTLKKIFTLEKSKKLYIADNLHPTLQPIAESLEYGINKLRNSLEIILINNGCQVLERRMDLKRISDAVTYLFVIAAVIARASRSYCLGMRDSEKELKIAQVFGYILYQKIEQLIKELNDGNYVNGDTLIKEISDNAFEDNAYFIEHPLARNF
ncbi:hypothetical protein PV327_000011 [Microctonus hyperodae]|uniref:Acyl-CoA dehydrogenase family member 9, mitochondrial n=1 Tax=Microctonus hyperodae TaxID=165561 RepID=A0AA39G5A0_MICHY|nr:hypothetical protein PV327_000011 [Microctonus hyperodae]